MSKTHKILMIACCLIGIGAAAAIWLFKVPGNSVFIALMLLLCPLSHIFMMKFMDHGHAGHEGHDHNHGQVIDVPTQARRNAENR